MKSNVSKTTFDFTYDKKGFGHSSHIKSKLMAAVVSKVQSKDFMSSNIRWRQPNNNKKENTEIVSSKYKDLCSSSRINANERASEDQEITFFSRGGRHRRGMKPQFHHHPTSQTLVSHSSPSSQRNKCDSPSVCDDANCQKDRKCCCCCEFDDVDGCGKTKELNNQLGHPDRKGRRRRGAELRKKELEEEEGKISFSNYSNYSAFPSTSITELKDPKERNGNICNTSEINTLERIYNFQERRCKTDLDEIMFSPNNKNRLPVSTPLTRALLLDDKAVSPKNLCTSNTIVHHRSELRISTPERKRRKMKQSPFNFDLTKDRFKTVKNGSENATRTTVAVSQNLGTMMDEIKMSKSIIDKDLDEMKEKSFMLEKDILLLNDDVQQSMLNGTKSLQCSASATDNHDSKGSGDGAQKKKIKVVAFGDNKYLNENVSSFSSCQTESGSSDPIKSIRTPRDKNNDGLNNQLLIQNKKSLENDIEINSEYVIRKRKSGLVKEASQVIPSDNKCLPDRIERMKSSIQGTNDPTQQKTTFFGTPSNTWKCYEQQKKEENSPLVSRHPNDMFCATWKNTRSINKYNIASSTVNVKENETEGKCPKAAQSSTAKIFCQPKQNKFFVEAPLKSSENSNFENRILDERAKDYETGLYHNRFGGELILNNTKRNSNIDRHHISSALYDTVDEQNVGFSKHNSKIQKYIERVEHQTRHDRDQPTKSKEVNNFHFDKETERKSNTSKLPKNHINLPHATNQSNKYCDFPNSSRMDNRTNNSALPHQCTNSSEMQNYKKRKQCRCHKNCFLQNTSKHENGKSQKNSKMRENMKSVDLTSDNSVILNTFSPMETREYCTTKNQRSRNPCIKSNPTTKSGNLHQINYHNSNELIEREEGLTYDNIPLRRAKTDLTLYTGQKLEDAVQADMNFSTPGCRKPINSSIFRLLQSKAFSKSDNNIPDHSDRETGLCHQHVLSPNRSTNIPMYCDDPSIEEVAILQQPTEFDEHNCGMIGFDHIVHNKRRIPDGMAHMTELCTRHKYQNNINLVNRGSDENIGFNCSKSAFSRSKILRPKSDSFNLVFCTGNIILFFHI